MEAEARPKLKEASEKTRKWAEEIRHHIHKHPEPGFEEVETQKFIIGKLLEIGVPESAIKVSLYKLLDFKRKNIYIYVSKLTLYYLALLYYYNYRNVQELV